MTPSAASQSDPTARRPRRLLWPVAALALLLALYAAPAPAGPPITQETDSAAIRKELERFRVLYTEDHPDVRRMERHLERALQLEAEQRAEARKKAAAQKARDEARKAAQPSRQ